VLVVDADGGGLTLDGAAALHRLMTRVIAQHAELFPETKAKSGA
jgi:hypothetical protein